MSTKGFILSLFITSLILGTSLLNLALAADPLPAPTISDITLNDGGILQGRIVDQQNIGRPEIKVTLRFQDRDVASTTTDANGQFVFQNLHGGVYQVVTAEGSEVFRLWAPHTAPPAAQNLAVVHTQNGYLVRNQVGGGQSGLKAFLGNPIVIPAIIATAVAVPIAVSSQHSPASP